MRWRTLRADFDPDGFDPGGFVTGSGVGEGPDPAGVRTIPLGHKAEGVVQTLELAIDVDDERGADIAVVTTPDTLGIVRMREYGTVTWFPITNLVSTTWKRANIQTTLNVELEVTVPTGGPREILLKQLWQTPTSLD
jgi:hypothetical protein